jgi:hypothetical protein
MFLASKESARLNLTRAGNRKAFASPEKSDYRNVALEPHGGIPTLREARLSGGE